MEITMKKLFLLLLIMFFLTMNVSAGVFSVDKGAIYTFGSLSLEKGFSKGYDSFEASLEGGFHFFLFNRFSLGVDATVTHYSYFGSSYNDVATYLSAEYFLGEKAGKILPFFGLGFGGGVKNYGGVDFSFIGAKIGGGLNFMVNDRVGLRVGANYFFDKVTASSDEDGSRIKLYLGFICFLY